MEPTRKNGKTLEIIEDEDVKFCVNCDDMEDLDVDPEADFDMARERFGRCRESGKFDGDICARLFVLEDEGADLFADEEEWD